MEEGQGLGFGIGCRYVGFLSKYVMRGSYWLGCRAMPRLLNQVMGPV